MITPPPRKADAGHDIRGDLGDAGGAVAGQYAERDEQACAARDQRDGAQAGVALTHLPLEADGDAAGESGSEPQDEFKCHRSVRLGRVFAQCEPDA
jgi:hypothetical protein